MRDEWQPIETAPKDGSEILVWSPMYKGRHFLANWDTNKYANKPRPYRRFSDERIWSTTQVRANQPTHWMPLPQPPTGTSFTVGNDATGEAE